MPTQRSVASSSPDLLSRPRVEVLEPRDLPSTIVTSFSPDNSLFPNPERGWYMPAYSNEGVLTDSDLQWYRSGKLSDRFGPGSTPGVASHIGPLMTTAIQSTLIHRRYNLSQYRGPSDNLPQSFLDSINADAAALRRNGSKMIPLFYYSNGFGDPDAPKATVLRQLDQLGPYLRQNADVIASIEFGLIGAWGEGHSSSNGLDSPQNTQELLAKLLQVTALQGTGAPAGREISVMIRYPKIKQTIYGATALQPTDAYNGTDRARVGHINNAFTGDWWNMGTYYWPWNGQEPYPENNAANRAVVDSEKNWLNQDHRFVPAMFETDTWDRTDADLNKAYDGSSTANEYSGANAIAEARRIRMSSGNALFNMGMLNRWWIDTVNSERAYLTIQKQMGYRYRLISSSVDDDAVRGGSLPVSFQITNDGFAAAYNRRHMELILRGNGQTYVQRIDVARDANLDPRFWLPGETKTINVTFALPGGMPTGDYQLLLNLPDPYPGLRSNPGFSIRLANAGVWEPATGYNVLASGVTVIASARRAPADFNGDGKSDMLWRYNGTGSLAGYNALYLMNGATHVEVAAPALGVQWKPVASGDFNGDGKADLFWYNPSTGRTRVWLMNGGAVTAEAEPYFVGQEAGWQQFNLVGAGDFDGDGRSDVVWWNAANGSFTIWCMNGTAIASVRYPSATRAAAWRVVGVGDFDGDGRADLFWWNSSNGQSQVWLNTGITASTVNFNTGGTIFASLGSGWLPVGVGDFDGDGKDDFLWRNPGSGANRVWIMNGSSRATSGNPGTESLTGANWVVAGIGDYDGDGKADILWRQTNGAGGVRLWFMNGAKRKTSGGVADLAPEPDQQWLLYGFGVYVG